MRHPLCYRFQVLCDGVRIASCQRASQAHRIATHARRRTLYCVVVWDTYGKGVGRVGTML